MISARSSTSSLAGITISTNPLTAELLLFTCSGMYSPSVSRCTTASRPLSSRGRNTCSAPSDCWMSSVHTRNSITCPGALVSLRESSSSTRLLPARLEHLSRVAHVADSVEPQLDPMIGANRVAPGDNVLRLAGADERGPDSDGLRALVRLGVVDLRDVVLDYAALQHVHGVEGDRGKRVEILRRGVATLFETWGKRLVRHPPNVIQGGLNVQPTESPSASCQMHSS